ncbi:hypothetical protein [Rhodococcus triatomae]
MGTKLMRGVILAAAATGVALASGAVAQAGGAPHGWTPTPYVEPAQPQTIVDPACIPVQPGVSVPQPDDVPCLNPNGVGGIMPHTR